MARKLKTSPKRMRKLKEAHKVRNDFNSVHIDIEKIKKAFPDKEERKKYVSALIESMEQ